MTKSAVAWVAAAPLVTWVVWALAPHPALVGLMPAPIQRAGAVLFVALVVWASAAQVPSWKPLQPAYRAGLIFGATTVLAGILGFDPAVGVAAALLFCAIALAGNSVYRAAQAGAWPLLVTTWLCGGIVLCGIALAASALRRPALLYAFSHGRAIGIFENPNELAMYALSIAAVACGALIAGAPRYRHRVLAAAALVIAVVTLVATGSRSGEASFAIGAIALAAMLVRARLAVAAVGALVVLGVLLAYSLDPRHNPAENESRLAAWRAGARTVALFPLTGVGIGAYERVYPAVRAPDAPGPENPIAFDPHNFYLAVAAETGLVGLGALTFVIVTFAREARLVLVRASLQDRRFAASVLAGLLAVGVHLLLNAFAMAIVLWVIMAALVLGLPRSVSAAVE